MEISSIQTFINFNVLSLLFFSHIVDQACRITRRNYLRASLQFKFIIVAFYLRLLNHITWLSVVSVGSAICINSGCESVLKSS